MVDNMLKKQYNNPITKMGVLKMKETKTKGIIFIGLFAAILCVCAQISIPTPFGIPFTLQTFAVALCGYILGAKKGALTVLVYILLGTVGLPVFSGFGAGFSKIFGATGGFIFGFLPAVVFCGLGDKKSKIISIIFGIIGIAICHLCGILQYSFITKNSFVSSFITVSGLFLVKDIISVILAEIISIQIKSAISRF